MNPQPTLAESQVSEVRLGVLPEWDLADLYPGRDRPELDRDLGRLAADAAAFRDRYQGRLAELPGAALGHAVARYEAMQETAGRIASYAELLRAGNVADPELGRFAQTTHERLNAISADLLFFTLELNRLDDAELDSKLADPALAHYRPWLRDLRAQRPHQLSDDLEKLLHEKSVVGRTAWVRLFDETVAGLRFPFRGRDLTEPEAMHLLSDPDGAVRREAALSIGEVLAAHGPLFALVTNTLAVSARVSGVGAISGPFGAASTWCTP
jgi:oligoendopeptidase F